MDRRFLATTAIASALTFSGVLLLTAPPATQSPGATTPPSLPLSFAGPSPAPSPIISNVHYSGCNEVRAAGAAPLYRDQPGYRPEMDGDDDGIACEPY